MCPVTRPLVADVHITFVEFCFIILFLHVMAIRQLQGDCRFPYQWLQDEDCKNILGLLVGINYLSLGLPAVAWPVYI